MSKNKASYNSEWDGQLNTTYHNSPILWRQLSAQSSSAELAKNLKACSLSARLLQFWRTLPLQSLLTISSHFSSVQLRKRKTKSIEEKKAGERKGRWKEKEGKRTGTGKENEREKSKELWENCLNYFLLFSLIILRNLALFFLLFTKTQNTLLPTF